MIRSLTVLGGCCLQAGGHAGTYQRAGQLLRSADQKIGEGVGALRRTRFMGMMEMGMDIGSPFRRPGGSLFMVSNIACTLCLSIEHGSKRDENNTGSVRDSLNPVILR